MMELQEIRDQLKIRLKETRYRHCLGVEEVSCDLAYIYGYDPMKASIAGLLHDCAKCLTDEELLMECDGYMVPVKEVELRSPQLLHAKVSAVYAKHDYGVEDDEVLNAIAYHCTGRPAMSLLEKIVFTADYIEPYRRDLPNIDEIRRTAYQDLDRAVCMVLYNTLEYLQNKGATIDTLSNRTYEYYKTLINAS